MEGGSPAAVSRGEMGHMEIFIYRHGQTLGPYPVDQIRAYIGEGQVSSDDLAWYEGAADWAPLHEIVDMASSDAAEYAPATIQSIPALRAAAPPATGSVPKRAVADPSLNRALAKLDRTSADVDTLSLTKALAKLENPPPSRTPTTGALAHVEAAAQRDPAVTVATIRSGISGARDSRRRTKARGLYTMAMAGMLFALGLAIVLFFKMTSDGSVENRSHYVGWVTIAGAMTLFLRGLIQFTVRE